ncbi:NHL repeat-containing protein [Gordonia rhizosphera]|uniref:NHL repeat-containing protein n=1 Tax=Gordonia rhizosphera TaxID=83341 RepID=UPI0002FCAE5E|nr:NHL repeat-containing protein [Gordonia rhizosphera]
MGAATRVTRTVSVRAQRPGATPSPAAAADARGWRAGTWLGAPAPGGLALPSATPAADTLYAPRGVWFDDDLLVVADTGNHRVLIWHGPPTGDHRPADVLLGQSSWAEDTANDGGTGSENGLQLPTGVLVHYGALIVCDAWNHRILIWHDIPTTSRPADLVLGQSDRTGVEPNRGGAPDATSFYWPFGVGIVDDGFWVADTGNRRVLGWLDGIPTGPDQPADVVLGQPDATAREENRGGPAGPCSFRWPHAIADLAGTLLVADAGNHRILGWSTPLLPEERACERREGTDADLVLGQPDFHTATEFPYAPQTAHGLRFPYALTVAGGELAVADTANNRILLWDQPGWSDAAHAGVVGDADGVLAQPSTAANGENRWDAVDRDTLCWPYGIHRHGNRMAIADSGNNRVVVWERG